MVTAQRATENWREVADSVRHHRAERLLRHEISCSLDGSVELVLTRELFVFDEAVICLIQDLRGVLYVGQLRQRFFQHNRLLHLAASWPVSLICFSWYLVAGEAERSAFEREFIEIL